MRRYHTLDGIRGVAAIFVVIGHAHDTLSPLGVPRFWLAVDLFFLISGFVLGQVYEPRIRAGMTVLQFMRNRYIRLYPLYIVGLLVGAASALATMLVGHGALGPVSFIIALLSGVLLLPSPTWTVSQDVMPLNFPGWSLFFELVANLLMVLVGQRLTDRLVLAIITVSGLVLLGGTFVGSPFGGESWPTFFWGFPRIGFSFFLGLLIQRRHWGRHRRTHLAWLVIAAPVVVMSLAPAQGGALLDIAMLVAIAPAIVWVGANVEPRNATLFTWLGDVSYPVYVLHIPILSIIWRVGLFYHHPVQEYAPALGVGYLIVTLAVSWLLDRYYDRPVRRAWLREVPRPSPRRGGSASTGRSQQSIRMAPGQD